jgi:hypothetical protein
LAVPATARGRGERKMEKCKGKQSVLVIFKDWSKSEKCRSLDLKTGNGHVVRITKKKNETLEPKRMVFGCSCVARLVVTCAGCIYNNIMYD